MPWCPNCKMEYQEGIKVCSDCGGELIELNENETDEYLKQCELADMEKEDEAQRLADFLEYSGIHNVSVEYFEETSTYKVSVADVQIKEAVKLYQAFLIAETSEEEKEEQLKKAKSELYKTHSYVKKQDKYNDFKSSVTVFIPFGIAILIFVALNLLHVIDFFGAPLQLIILTACAVGFLYVGISSMMKLKSIEAEIGEEKDHSQAINQWLKIHITPDVLESVTDENSSDEVNYIHRTERIKEMVLEEFGDMDENFVDHLVEEYYNDYLEQQ